MIGASTWHKESMLHVHVRDWAGLIVSINWCSCLVTCSSDTQVPGALQKSLTHHPTPFLVKFINGKPPPPPFFSHQIIGVKVQVYP